MTLNNPSPGPRSLQIQETATALLRSMTPLLHRCRSVRKVLMPSVENNRGNQQSDNIMWQQEMFHRILNIRCLVQEGLAEERDLDAVGKEVLLTITAVHPDGEWSDLTRDKLLFLQDLFQSRCITEADYRAAKRPLLSRLSDQGAQLNSEDVKIFSSPPKESIKPPVKAGEAFERNVGIPAQASPASSPVKADVVVSRKTPIKHVMDAMSRLKCTSGKVFVSQEAEEKAKEANRVPHALDFIRPRDCPTREPPLPSRRLHEPVESPLFYNAGIDTPTSRTEESCGELHNATKSPSQSSTISPSKSLETPTRTPSSITPCKPTRTTPKWTPKSALTTSKSSLSKAESASTSSSKAAPITQSPRLRRGKSMSEIGRKFSGLVRKFRGEEEKQGTSSDTDDAESDDDQAPPPSKSLWKRFDLLRQSPKKPEGDEYLDDDKDPLLSALEEYPESKVSKGAGIHGQGPNIAKLKKKVNIRAAPTNFFIDKVLGDNIKSELARIRTEMNRSNPLNQTFTNDQIDAIATRLPVDQRELMRFFPQSWCDRYGDIVLEVVHKEFKSHVSEMDGLRRAAKEKKNRSAQGPGKGDDTTLQEKHTPQQPTPQSTYVGNDDIIASSSSPTPKDRKKTEEKGLENDENKTENEAYPKPPYVKKQSPQGAGCARKSPKPINRCFTTDGSNTDQQAKTATAHVQRECSPLTPRRVRRGLGFDTDLDGRLGAEIQRMPLKTFNECGSFRC